METNYIGDELSLFEHAHNWKKYWSSFIIPYLGESLIEAGAGIGGTTRQLLDQVSVSSWQCVEPDPSLLAQIEELKKKGVLPDSCSLAQGFVESVCADESADSILYIDVIEHIEQDGKELEVAHRKLKKGGHLIVLVPAHNFLFSPFDKAIGHYRRYNKKMLRAVLPKEFKIKQLKYLDTVGLLASSANKLLLKQSYPTLGQIKTWDRFMVPLSKICDPLLNYNLGKSVLLIAEKVQ